MTLKTQKRIHHENFIQCTNFKNEIDRISEQDDTLNTMTDPNGNKLYTYSLDGIVYLPLVTDK